MKDHVAPIVLFSFNRPDKLKKLFNSLKKNKLSKKTIIYIFQDNYKNAKDKKNVKKCIRLINSIKYFKKKKFFLRKKNFGFYKNFREGLNYFFQREKKGIVLEDDLIVSEYFLKFMNLCLSKYKNEKKVWHISGWNYDIEIKNKFDAYFGKHISSWGWATWNDRYEKYEKNCEKLLKWKKNKISKFNLDNSYNFYSQIERNYTLELNTFAVFWYATIFNHNGLTLFPKLSLVKNIGFGKTATHSKSKGVFLNDKISKKNTFLLPDKMKENIIISEKVKNYFRKSKKKNYLLKILRFFK